MSKIIIAIDGPASSGKSTVAKIIAKKLNLIYLDTGAMYRAVTFLALKHQLESPLAILKLIKEQPISFQNTSDGQLVFLGDQEVTQVIRENEVTKAVSKYAAMKEIRTALVDLQRQYADQGGVIMDGRDIGTVVLPQADLKIFLVASVDERAKRRYQENIEKGIATDFETLKADIAKRDELDSTRAESPLKQADDAILLDTTGLNIEQVVSEIESLAKKKIYKLA
ncbi:MULTISPECIES: (d)CMP kinase [unclassified Enterococcus]|uniref:(d)CMP kinase n=1 Tax=unclassified Enterococcus TaxID=2608891 RepID=UPI001555D176|nr:MULTISPECIES: (d)CMP kinase [unclassified Enterococcus]MBS7576213.1 (d)CMP kinase [Enterococcus sp. MMGLQ5-2]MBS7583446.1 (d)CMP kinase [Enterococcus sp. MMGLQ5-1]NPD11306.1 (d)CMP kinase [Enterococcus sp. MMGLQ5-1]NPD36049.1 (d)CMP kinase [Enterococcus sp. MMGLQ5-2]